MSCWRPSLTRVSRTARFSTCAPRRATAQRDRDRIRRERDRIERTTNTSVENDPALSLLLRDADNAVKGTKGREIRENPPLSNYPFYDRVKVAQYDEVQSDDDEYANLEEVEEGFFGRERKAPAAFMGGVKAKMVSLPVPLIVQMEEIVEGASRALLLASRLILTSPRGRQATVALRREALV